MPATQFGTVVGLALGAIWGFLGAGYALLAAVLATVGFVVALVVQGRVDLTDFLGHDQEHQRS